MPQNRLLPLDRLRIRRLREDPIASVPSVSQDPTIPDPESLPEDLRKELLDHRRRERSWPYV